MDPHASREEDALRDWEHLFSSYAEVRQGIRVEALPRYRTTSAASRRSIEALVWSDLRKRLSKVLSRSNRAMRDGIQLSEALTGDGAAIFRHACAMGLEGIVSKRTRLIETCWIERMANSAFGLLAGGDHGRQSPPSPNSL
jgi:hypothetical protein